MRDETIDELGRMWKQVGQQFDDIRTFLRLMSIADAIVWHHFPSVLEDVMLHIAFSESSNEKPKIEEWISPDNKPTRRPLNTNMATLYADTMLRIDEMLKNLSPELHKEWLLAIEVDRKRLKEKPDMFNELLLRQSLILGVSVVDDAFTRTIDLLAPALGWKKPKKCGFGEILYGYTDRFFDLSDEVFKQLFDLVSEIVATRNLLAHNLGKVDEKYLNKFPSSGLHVGDTRVIDHAYVLQSLLYLEGFTKTILEIAQGQLLKQAN